MTSLAAKCVLEQTLISLPTLLQQTTAAKLKILAVRLTEKQQSLPADAIFLHQLARCLACSEFVSNIILESPELILELHNSQQLYKTFYTNDFVNLLNKLSNKTLSEAEFIKSLRVFRRQTMLRIAWRDLCGLATLNETISELSSLADVAINYSLQYLQAKLQVEHGKPIDDSGEVSDFIVLALGKLGSYELNFSSDIDLIFCYSNTKPDFEKYYYRLSQQLINALSRITADGFVFRVDMRLRPYGSSGALVFSKKSMIAYYQSQGREWERFALSKARLINPSFSGEKLLQTIKQFVYRRYIDFSVIDALREMKNSMRRESHALEDNIKRGEGGIREIEFIVQVFQLIRGGKEPWLQNSSIFKMLPKLAEFQCLPSTVVHELIEAYVFFRVTEHHLQEINDQQTQTLPRSEFERVQLAYSLNFDTWESFYDALNKYREKVAWHFNQMIALPNERSNIISNIDPRFTAIITGTVTEAESIKILNEFEIKNPLVLISHLKKFQQSFNFHAMNEATKPKLALLLQQLFPLACESKTPETTVRYLFLLLEQIIRRSIYIILLLENPLAMVQLIELFNISPWISEQLIKYPFLLEELIDTKTLYQPYSTEKLQDQLRQKVLSIPFDDLEAQMDCLRQFKQIQVLRVAASDATGALPLMKVSDHLTNTASVIVGHAERIAWLALVEKHGHPTINGEQLHADDFLIIAYGKLGGFELGYGSDLDLVFLHPDTKNIDMTDGEKPITNVQFYFRLAQRMIHILTTNTPMGKLYEIDTRLRPSGASGLLVTSLESYSTYQNEIAWTWEHQALIRARVIFGSNDLAEKFNAVRYQVLTKPRDLTLLKNEVIAMRQKMIEQLAPHADDLFDVNNDYGGIKDIEFIVQFLALKHANHAAAVIFYTDNIRILEALLKFNILSENEVAFLSDIYCKFREIYHRAALQQEKPFVNKGLFAQQINKISVLWNHYFKLSSIS